MRAEIREGKKVTGLLSV